jgi:hypothetical protein
METAIKNEITATAPNTSTVAFFTLWLFSTRGMGVPHRGEAVNTTRAALWLFPFSHHSECDFE